MTKMKMARNLVFATTIIAVVLILWGIMTGDIGTLMNMIVVSVLVAMVPFFFYKYSKMMWIKTLEEQIPAFLRDLADLIGSGMSFSEAIRITCKSNYGNLSAEVKEMNNKLSWGVPFIRTLDMFKKNIRGSRIITEVVQIIKESYRSGGNIAATLDSTANSIIMLKEAEENRTSMVKQQVFIMYGIFFMLLVITILIIVILVPMITTATNQQQSVGGIATLGFKNPCIDTSIFPCSLYSSIGIMLNSGSGIASYYTSLFFLTVIIEAIFIGLIAGQVGSDSVSAGFKHSLIMLFIGVGVFFFLAKLGMFL